MGRKKKVVAEPVVTAPKVKKEVVKQVVAEVIAKEEVVVEAAAEIVEAVAEKIAEVNKAVIAEKSSLEILKNKIVSKARFILQTIRG